MLPMHSGGIPQSNRFHPPFVNWIAYLSIYDSHSYCLQDITLIIIPKLVIINESMLLCSLGHNVRESNDNGRGIISEYKMILAHFLSTFACSRTSHIYSDGLLRTLRLCVCADVAQPDMRLVSEISRPRDVELVKLARSAL
mmetsp:Transcript_14533/g.42990  ORF Transcript_14533/g.42990 Transcript_14533/m.42990 type:complete len:141 (-) Transcript_14533:549-971(-)